MVNRTSKNKPTTGLYKRSGSDNWYVDLGRDVRGNRERRSTRTTDLEEAQKQLEIWKIEKNLKRILPSQFGTKPAYPFTLAVKAHADYLMRKNQRSFMNSGFYIVQLLSAFFGTIPCHEITKPTVQKFINKRLDMGILSSTVKRDISMLRAILNRAYDNEYIDRRPRIPRLPPGRPRDRILQVDEEIRLLDNSPSYLREIIIFALETGGRKMEILSLNWKNVDMKAKRIKFVKTKNGKDRVIPMTARCRKLLFAKRREPTGQVFTFLGNGIKDIKTSYATAKDKADIKGLTFHDLRHTFASRFIMRGGTQQPLMMILGHSTPAMTQRYTHLSQDFLSDAIEVMNINFKQGRTQGRA